MARKKKDVVADGTIGTSLTDINRAITEADKAVAATTDPAAVVAAAIKNAPKPEGGYRFVVVSGEHLTANGVFRKGDVIVSNQPLDEIFVGKFSRVPSFDKARSDMKML